MKPAAAAAAASIVACLCAAPAAAQTTSVGVRLGPGNDCVRIEDRTVSADDDSAAAAIGVLGGGGRDTIRNVGTLSVTATVESDESTQDVNATGISANPDGERKRRSHRKPRNADECSTERGMRRKRGHEEAADAHTAVTNDGVVRVAANATADDAAAPVDILVRATGVIGSAHDDRIENSAGTGESTPRIEATATAAATTRDTVFTAGPSAAESTRTAAPSKRRKNRGAPEPEPEVLGGPNTITAIAAGVAGGDGDDTLTNDGEVSATAEASLAAGTLSGSFVSTPADMVWNSTASANAAATGLTGGDGDDTIANRASLTAQATAGMFAGSLTLTGMAFEATITSAHATAAATGIDADDGDDRLDNTSTLTANSTATADSAGIGLMFLGANVVSDTFLDAGTTATAEATGMDAGAGSDRIDNTGMATAHADAQTFSAQVALNVAGIAVTEAASTATARATGIDAGDGRDRVTSGGTLTTTAEALADGIDLAISALGLSATQATRWDSGTNAAATAQGIEGGADNDRLGNAGTLTTVADAETRVAAISATLSPFRSPGFVRGLPNRLTANTITDLSSNAFATAGGMSGGGGDDWLHNKTGAFVDVDALAQVSATEMNFGLNGDTIPALGMVAGVLLGTGAANSSALATGLDGGGGDDWLLNDGTVDAFADTDLPQFGLSLRITNGPSSDLDSVLGSDAAAVRAGSGDDVAWNRGALISTADTSAFSLGVGVTTTGLYSGVASSAKLESLAVGIDGGHGDDWLRSDLSIAATARSNATAINAAVNTGTPTTPAPTADTVPQPSFGIVRVVTGVETAARAVGIDADGPPAEEVTDLGIDDGFPILSSAGINYRSVQTIASGDDEIVNTGTLDVEAQARSITLAASLAGSRGITAAKTTTTADADANAILAGGGDDEIWNHGAVTNEALANADTVNFAMSLPSTGLNPLTSAMNGGTHTTSRSVGIDADSPNAQRIDEVRLVSNLDTAVNPTDEVEIHATRTVTRATGEDFVLNDAKIDSFARAITLAADGAVASRGIAIASGDSSATAASTAIDGGGDRDVLVNRGELLTNAVANTDAAAAAVVLDTGLAAAWSGGSASAARAVGIAGDGGDDSTSTKLDLLGSTEHAEIRFETETLRDKGDDFIANEGRIEADAVAVNIEADVGVVVAQGVGAAIADSAASAETVAIDAGGGDDKIVNRGELLSDSIANADSVAVTVTAAGVAAAANALLDGGTTATATSFGIDADSHAESSAKIGATSDFALEPLHVASSITRETTRTGGTGDDRVWNEGTIDTTARAFALSVAGAVLTLKGAAGAISTATGVAETTAIRTGGGDDKVGNQARISATAFGNADAVNVTVDPGGVALTADTMLRGGTQARAVATGIETDGGAGEAHSELTLEHNDFDFRLLQTTTELAATGDDLLYNAGEVVATANTIVPSIGVTVTGAGVGAVIQTGESESLASALDTGGGDDVVVNKGKLEAIGRANADTINVSVAGTGVALTADGIFNGGTTSIANARGIDADGRESSSTTTLTIARGEVCESDACPRVEDGVGDGTEITYETVKEFAHGDDVVVNTGQVDATTLAISPSIGVAIQTTLGAAIAFTRATSEADSTAIDVGAGEDFVANSGTLTSTARANADAISVAVAVAGGAVAGNAVWDGGVTASATARGIDADGPLSETTTLKLSTSTGDDFVSLDSKVEDDASGDVVHNEGQIDSTAFALVPAVSVAVTPAGVTAAASTATAATAASGIETGSGKDKIGNEGAITTTANSIATAINVSVTPAGVALAGDAVWNGGTTAAAAATGLDAGNDDDKVRNDGVLTSTARSFAPSLSVPVAVYGVAGAVTTATSEANAYGIVAGTGDDRVVNTEAITAHSVANADSFGVSVNIFGVAVTGNAVWDGGVNSTANAAAIDAGAGRDYVKNTAAIGAEGDAFTISGQVPFTVGGVVAALSTANAQSDVAGIDTGDERDYVDNRGAVTADSDATAFAVTGSIGVFGVALGADAIWDGGTTAEALVAGIDAGAADDRIDNSAKVDAHTRARATAAGGALTVIGVAASLTTANSTARADGIAAGDGDDKIDNDGEVIAVADARATNVAIDLSGAVGAGALDRTWEGGTHADADAIGLNGGAGEDKIDNDARVQADATGDTDSTSIGATIVAGFTAATSASIAQSRSTGIDGGDSDDRIDNDGELAVTSTADAGGISFSSTGIGAAFADTFMEHATRAEAFADGASGGAGDDRLKLGETSVIDVTATAKTKANNIALVVDGYSQADSTALAAANAVGVGGGEGADRLRLDGTITTLADADSLGRAISYPFFGAGFADVANRAEATAVGAAGDSATAGAAAGKDRIVSKAVIDARATAATLGQTISIQAGGASFGEAQTSAVARATGIDGGAAADLLVNAESLSATSTADITARSFGLGFLGGFIANRADATAESFATGIAGGTGADEIVNLAVANEENELPGVAASATATATAKGTTVNVFGVGNADHGSHATATATGIDSGEGNDGKNTIDNFGTVDATASATATEESTAWSLGGVTRANGLSTATANAFGLAGSDEYDWLRNAGTITVNASTALSTSGSSTAVFGVPSAGATIDGALRAIGMRGAGGSDDLLNTGTIGVTTTSMITGNASAWTLGGASSLSTPAGGLTADSDVFGLAGGDGEDWLASVGGIALSATGTGTLTSSSWTFAGAASDRGTLTTAIRATAIDGGADDDEIANGGTVTVTSNNALTATGGARALFGGANGGADLGVSAAATGLAGGEGDDRIHNESTIDIDALASLTTTSVFSTFAGAAAATPQTGSTATAIGITAGNGRDRIWNLGSIDASATATVSATGGTVTRFGDANADTTTTATATAIGVSTSDGDDRFVNRALVSATATALPTELTNAAAGGLFVDGISRANTTATLESSGALLGDGADEAVNRGTIRAGIGATLTVTASSTGVSALGLSLNAEADATATANAASAVGLHAGEGRNAIENHSAVSVTLSPTAVVSASADGAGLAEGDGVAGADAFGSSMAAAGLRSGTGDDRIDNFGAITVTASPSMSSDSVSDADGLDFFTAPRSTANASSLVNDTRAVGIDSGDGANTINNEGLIDVTASPQATAQLATADFRARNDSSGNPITLAVDSFATSGAEANGTRALGIAAGDGRNVVRNSGDIEVAARPTALAQALANGTGWDGDAEALATALANDAQAIGIVVGNGGNVVINDGRIVVRAEATANSYVEANGGLAEFSDAITITVVERIPVRFGLLRLIVGYIVRTVTQTIEETVIDAGEEVEDAQAEASATAIGILTGDGNDKVINTGVIDVASTTSVTRIEIGTVTNYPEVATSLGVGIRTGGGNDTLVLADGSAILGHVHLDDGDDVLALHGTSLTAGNTFGGAGTDRIEFHGTGEFVGALLEFERAIKHGGGTFNVAGLPSIGELTIERGTLSVEGDYVLAADGVYETFVYGDGRSGQLEASDTIGLGGELQVRKGSHHYAAGTTFEIVAAESVTGSFSTINLPSSPRLSFELVQSPTSVEIVTEASSFTKFLKPKHGFGHGLAGFFDRLTPKSDDGRLTTLVEGLRDSTDASALSDTLTQLSPAAYNTMTLGTLTSVRRSMDSVRDRAATLRSSSGTEDARGNAMFVAGERPFAFAEQRRGAARSWGSAFGYSGREGATVDGYGAFDYDSRGVAAGLDWSIGSRFALGASFTAADTAIRLDGPATAGDVDSYSFSAYGAAYFDNGAYAQGAIALGTSDYLAVRSIATELLQASGSAEYEADQHAAFLETGRAFGTSAWRHEAYGALHYVDLREQAFAEKGLNDLGYFIDARDVQSLTSEIGWRTARELELRHGTLTPRLNVAWLQEQAGGFSSVGRLAGATDVDLTLPGRELSADGARLGASLDYRGEADRTWSVRWNSERRGDFDDRGLLLQFHSRF